MGKMKSCIAVMLLMRIEPLIDLHKDIQCVKSVCKARADHMICLDLQLSLNYHLDRCEQQVQIQDFDKGGG